MIEYAGRNLEWRQDFVKSIRAIPYAELVVLRDIDRCTCIPGKKKEVRDELRCAESDVFVVVQEIEGWYLAGASDALCRDLGINQPRTTHHVTKEKLKRLCPGEYSTLGEFKLDLLDSFDLDRAINRNSSFAYFCRHMGLASGG